MPEAAHVTELKEIEFSCELEPVNEDREEIDVQELKSWMSEGRDFQLLDVREGWERAMAKIDSHHIPVGELLTPGSDLVSHGLKEDKPLVIYCASGGRSLMATRQLRARCNASTILSLKGGIGAWAQAGN